MSFDGEICMICGGWSRFAGMFALFAERVRRAAAGFRNHARVTWSARAELGRDELNLAPRGKCSDLTCLALAYWHSLFWISRGHVRDPSVICARADAVAMN